MLKRTNVILRAVMGLGVTTALVFGVTMASLTSTATLTNNTISSATATLEIDNTDNGAGFGSTDTGFSFSGLVPGADYGAAQHFSLKNSGSADLNVTVFATIVAPTGSIDKSKVHVKFTNTSFAGSAEYTLAQLEAVFNDVPSTTGAEFLATSETNDFDVQVKLDADAIVGSSASVSGFDLVFTGSSVVTP